MATVRNADTATLGRLFNSLSVLQSAGPDSPRVSRGETRIGLDPGTFVSGPTFTGTGFSFDAAGRPTGGTVTGVHVPGYKVVPGYGVAGIEVPLAALYAAAVQGAGEALVPDLLAGNDTFVPGFGATGTLHGYGGDDLFHVQPGPALGPPAVDGGAGMDTVALSRFDADLRSNTTVEVGSGSLVVGRPDLGERVTCISIEAVRFDDGTLSFDPATVGGQVYILFEAALGRAPGAAGLGYFADAAERHGLPAAASGLLAAPETRARLDGLDAAGFIDAIYRSALGRCAEPGGLEHWRGRLDAGGDGGRGAVLAGIAASDEAEARWAAALATGVFGADPDAVAVVRAHLAATTALPNALNLAYFAALPVRDIEDVLAYNFAGVPDADFVATLVRNAYGPDASDPEAVAYYTQALGSGAGTRADVLHAYAFSPGMDARIAPYVTDHGVLYA